MARTIRRAGGGSTGPAAPPAPETASVPRAPADGARTRTVAAAANGSKGRARAVDGQRPYWDRVADEKTFTHPLNAAWLRGHVAPDARVLDYGCGYGRSLAESDGSFDAVLLLAVLTCIPDDRGQDALMREVRRLLRPGGLLHVSDMPLQTDTRNLARYADDAPRFCVHGVFETGDGAVVRHHDARRLDALLEGFDEVAAAPVEVGTMNGNPATAWQVLARRRPA